MAQPTSRTGFQSAGGAGPNLTVNKPTTLKEDDYLLMLVSNKGGGLPTVSGGGTWTLLGDATSGNAMANGTTRGAVFGRKIGAPGSEPASYTVGNISDSGQAICVAIANVSTTDPINAFSIESNAAPNRDTAGVTTDSDDCLIVGVALLADNITLASAGWTATSPATLTQPTGGQQSSASGTDCSVGFATAGKATAGATGALAWAPFSTDGDSVTVLIALNPDETPVWRSGTAVVEAASSGNLTPAKPSGLADGDLLLVFATSKTGKPTGVSGGAGAFTEIDAEVSGIVDAVVFGKIITNAAGEPATYTVTCPGTGNLRTAACGAVRGCDSAAYLDTSASQANASGATGGPAITTIGHVLVIAWPVNGDDGAFTSAAVFATDPTAMTTEIQHNTVSGTDMCWQIRRGSKQQSGSTGVMNYTPANAADNIAISISLRGPVPVQALTDGGGIPSDEAFGVGTIAPDQVLTDGGAIPSEEAFGAGIVARAGDVQALTDGGGVPSEEAFGVGTIEVAAGQQSRMSMVL